MAQAVRGLVIGTRGSPLAVWQAEWLQAELRQLDPGLPVSLKRIKTTGDKILDSALATIVGKGLFVKEIEEALLRGDIDIAVHSMKDVPTHLPPGLEIIAIPKREDPRDVFIGREGRSLDQMSAGARIGTSSLRRQAQLLAYRPDFKISMLRGNVDTRLRKLEAGEFDGIVLAAAGLHRLRLQNRITEYLSVDICLPAISQGALGLEGRRDDVFVRQIISKLEDAPSRIAVSAERAFLQRLEGGCQVPIAAHATISGDRLTLSGLIAAVDGSRVLRGEISGSVSTACSLGEQLADDLLSRGGDEILKAIYEKA
jgi:hydroxymethylbilane synthase